MDRVVVVTGAGRGLGRALARGLAAQGDRVVAIGRDAGALAETGRGLPSGSFTVELADVADHAALIAGVHRAIERHGRVDGLFANAAVYPRGLMSEQPLPLFMEAMAINVGGVAAAMQAVLPAMMDRAHGRIVTVGSFADRGPLPDSAAYSASKGALHALTKAAAAEVGADYPDLLVNEWVPGALATAMGLPDGHPPERAAAWGLALLDLPAGGPTGRIFVEDRLEEPPLGLKRRVLRKLRLG